MSKIHNAKTKANRESDQGNGVSGPDRMGTVQPNSPAFRDQQIGTSETDNKWRNSDREYPRTEGSIDYGKILERLDKLEEKYIKYLTAHQQRLNARLQESQESKVEFLNEAAEIRSGIYDLIATSQTNSNNGNS